jgi:hypothetical protein
MPTLVYHVLLFEGNCIVRKGNAKKASVAKDSKKRSNNSSE